MRKKRGEGGRRKVKHNKHIIQYCQYMKSSDAVCTAGYSRVCAFAEKLTLFVNEHNLLAEAKRLPHLQMDELTLHDPLGEEQEED